MKNQPVARVLAMNWFDRWLPRISMMVLIGIGLAFLWKLIFTDLLQTVTIGGTAAGSLEQANDQIIQLTQWVIATVFLVGGSLVGLNWYQSERRYQSDRKNDTSQLSAFHQAVDELIDRVSSIERDRLTLRDTLDRAERILDFLDVANEMNSADRFVDLDQRITQILTKYPTTDIQDRKKLARYVENTLIREDHWLQERVMVGDSFATRVDLALDEAVRIFQPDFPDIAAEISAKLDQIRTLSEIARRNRPSPE